MSTTPVIKGLPEGAIVKPLGDEAKKQASKRASATSASAIKGLPAGSIVKPLSTKGVGEAIGDDQTLSISEFASRIKSKHPELKDIEDDALVGSIIAKHPEFKSRITLTVPSVDPHAGTERKYGKSRAAAVAEGAGNWATRGLLTPEQATVVGSLGSVKLARQQFKDVQQQVALIASRKTGSDYTPEQKSKDLEAEAQKIHKLAYAVGSDEAVGRILSGASSPVGIAMMIASKVPGLRQVAGAAGLGMSAEDIGKKREGESTADFLERNLLATAGVTGSLAAIGEVKPTVKGKVTGKPATEPTPGGEPFREALQSSLKAGKKIVYDAGEKLKADTERVTAINAKRASQFADKVAKIDEDHAARIKEIQSKYADKVEERNQKIAEQTADYNEKLEEARKKWTEEAHDALADKRLEEAQTSHRETLEKTQKEYSKRTIDNLKSTYDNLRKDFNQRWKGMRNFVSDYATVKPGKVLEAVAEARKRLAGTPESKAILDQIEKNVSEKKTLQEGEGGGLRMVAKESIPFQEARTNAHAILEQAYNAEDANLRAALFGVYDAYDAQLRQCVKEAGIQRSLRVRDPIGKEPPSEADTQAGKRAVADYDKLKADWREFKTDWDDKGSVKEGGSPLVKARKAVDASEMERLVTGDVDGRLRSTLAKYIKHGASVELLNEIIDTDKKIGGLPKPKPTTEVPGFEKTVQPGDTPIERKLGEAGVAPFDPKAPPEPPKPVADPEFPEKPAAPKEPVPLKAKVADIATERAKAIRNQLENLKSLRPWDWIILSASPFAYITAQLMGHDIGAMAGAASPLMLAAEKMVVSAMDKPKFINWLAKPGVRDLSALSHMPPGIQAAFKEQIIKVIDAEKSANKPPKVAPIVRKWLDSKTLNTSARGATQVAAGAAAVGSLTPTPIGAEGRNADRRVSDIVSPDEIRRILSDAFPEAPPQ